MKLKTFLIVGCLGGIFTLSSCTAPTSVKDYSAYVNPFIGTGGHGHTFPGAVVPHGMIQPSPDTRIDGWDACSGYYHQWFLTYTRQRHRLLRLRRRAAHAHRWQTAISDYRPSKPDTSLCLCLLARE